MEQYRERTEGLGITGGAVVSGSFQVFDQSYLLDALDRLGPGYVGVTQVRPDITDQEIMKLDEAGVRAIRFNAFRGGPGALDDMEPLANRVFDVAGWHCEFYVDSRDLPDLTDRLTALPSVAIDHLGMHEDGLPHLLKLVDGGVKVKATGFGRIEMDPEKAIKAILSVDPGALLFGTDLPSTRAERPFLDEDPELIRKTVPAEHLQKVLWQNAADFYRLTET